MLLLAYVALMLAAYRSTLQPASLGLRAGLCGDMPCVSWVMPGGFAWDQGARPGMVVLSVNGRSLSDINAQRLPFEGTQEADLRTSGGEVLNVKAVQKAIGQGPLKFSLWVLGGMFALLGAAVVVRRPDLPAARMFGLFSGFAALGLAVGPSAGGVSQKWALIVQAMTIFGVGATLIPVVLTLGENVPRPAWVISPLIVFVGTGIVISVSYLASVLMVPSLFELVRPVGLSYLAISVLGAVGLLAFPARREPSRAIHQQARIALWGIILSSVPFVSFTLIPEALGQESLLPVHFTVLTLGLMPAFFVYAILQHQLWGIRRLVHRGMVHTIAALVLVTAIALGVAGMASELANPRGAEHVLLLSLLVVSGIIIFPLLRRWARWLVDNLIYRDVMNYQEVLDAMHKDVLKSAGPIPHLAQSVVTQIALAMHLESALLFLGHEPGESKIVASAGPRADNILGNAHHQLREDVQSSKERDLVEVRIGSEFLLVVNLRSSGRYLGYLLLGPRERGEVLVEEEKRVAILAASFLAAAIDKAELSEDLRALNQRLLKAGEMERARMAGDIHDGPLQKAMLLAATDDVLLQNRRDIARQLASELRELCWRLRPTVLDDLGLIPALEWLLDDVSKRSGLATNLSLKGLSDEARFTPDIELALFRFTQEATNNVIKHARASSINTSVSIDDESLTLKVQDDGVGLALAAPAKAGFGLSEMRERLLQVGGFFDVLSAPGLGTTIVARVPLGDALQKARSEG